MGLFRRVFGKTNNRAEGDPVGHFGQLVAQHSLPALDKQLHLQDLVGEADWLLDQDAGTLTFGGQLACRAQILGSEAESDRTWLWAWANDSLSSVMTESANAIRRYGEEHGLSEFTQPQLPTGGDASAESLALTASMLTDADAYYRGPYDGGAVFVLLSLPDDAPRQIEGDLLRAVRTLSVAPMALAVGLDRASVDNYLRWIGLETVNDGANLIGRDRRGKSVSVEFDRLGRVSRISSTLSPTP